MREQRNTCISFVSVVEKVDMVVAQQSLLSDCKQGDVVSGGKCLDFHLLLQ
jgi:hypothetical protein